MPLAMISVLPLLSIKKTNFFVKVLLQKVHYNHYNEFLENKASKVYFYRITVIDPKPFL